MVSSPSTSPLDSLPSKLKAVVFDLDGTLIDSEPDLRVALNKLLVEDGRREVVRAEVVKMIGDGVPKLVERGYVATGGLPDGPFAPVVARFNGFYEGHTADLSQPFPGVAEVLMGLRDAGLKLGVCTNKPEKPMREILEFFGFTAFFGALVGGDTLDGIRKPDPRHLAAVLDVLGVSADHAVMVGDNHNDVATARNLKVPVIAVSFGYAHGAPAELGADALIDSFADLLPALATVA